MKGPEINWDRVVKLTNAFEKAAVECDSTINEATLAFGQLVVHQSFLVSMTPEEVTNFAKKA